MPESRLTQQQRQLIQQRASSCCEYCLSQAKFSPDPFSIEHIIPRSKGGTSNLDNLAVACQGCNNFKYNHTEAIDPITGESVPLYHPRQQNWRDHFTWSNDSTQMLGLTPTGRATIERLQLNRNGVVNLRRVLHSIEQHPPHNYPFTN
ncbi:MAG TPA: HNH endonuclease [Cyanobacteria bacterium UBA11369]|nr:HNH endonuclease [Cyanobacteria bacterium UBA8543]HAZ44846.1 HNH endonuclease [Cyanobacteria bacterium UBA11371]HBE33230.1 HNH endonuclease [Cyanobacteria bacterium UBA11368]HBE51400.1 HNH endonuclease [Cyanobacteria bacterium UBA11369]